jgi:hypothetical protein
MAELHPDKPSLVAPLLLHRPLCVPCIATKSGLSMSEVDDALTVIGACLQVHRSDERCDNCGAEGPGYSLRSTVNP